MFLTFAIISMFSYAIHDALITNLSRKIDNLSLIAYRGLSLGISMSPALLFSSLEEITQITHFLPQLFGAIGCSIIGVFLFTRSLQLLPLGIGSAIRLSSITIGGIAIGLIFFEEFLNAFQYLFITIILMGVFVLGYSPISVTHLKENNTKLGIFYSILMGLFVVAGSSLMGSISRELSPFVAGYFWETGVGILALILGLLRKRVTSTPLQKISFQKFISILLRIAPAGVGSICFALALVNGPLGVANAMLSGIVIIGSIFGVFFLQEKLKVFQWLGIGIIIFGIIGVNLT